MEHAKRIKGGQHPKVNRKQLKRKKEEKDILRNHSLVIIIKIHNTHLNFTDILL